MIDFKNVVIKYGDFTAMNDLSIHIKEGEFFSFLGPSGSGKTTVLRALTGFVKISGGSIWVGDKDISDLSIEKRNIGIVFQSYALFPTMNVYENIAYGLRVRRVPKQKIDEEVRLIASQVDLTEEQLFKKVSELSGGQQQRVAIARAMIIKPKILCLDEPLSNLDAKLRGKLRLELKRLQKDFGITTIYVTHDQEEALTLSDRIAVFDNGNLEQVGTPSEIYNTPRTEFVANFIGEVNRVDAAKLSEVTNKLLKLDLTLPAYVLIHNIKLTMAKNDVAIPGTIIDLEYFGLYVKYTLETTNGMILKFIVLSSDQENIFEINSKQTLYVNKNAIKQYR